MPQNAKQRKAAFAELSSRKQGKSLGMFKGMKGKELKAYAHADLDPEGPNHMGKGGGKGKGKGKGRGKGKRPAYSAADQGEALRKG